MEGALQHPEKTSAIGFKVDLIIKTFANYERNV
jgi:hypothetical protein